MNHKRYHGVLMWNDVTVNWSRVASWFGTCSAPGARMRARGLVYPLLVAQTNWFGILDVCSVKGEWVEHSIKGHDVRVGNNVKLGFRFREAPMGHMKLLLSKGGSFLRGDVGTKLKPEIRTSIGMGDSW